LNRNISGVKHTGRRMAGSVRGFKIHVEELLLKKS
jgi:hypothetical protein